MIEHGALQRVENVLVEVDDFKTALTMALELECCAHSPASAMDVLSKWVATLREYYVEVGRKVERNEKRD